MTALNQAIAYADVPDSDLDETSSVSATIETVPEKSARDWAKTVAAYRMPSMTRSLVDLGVTVTAFAAIWLAAIVSFQFSIWLSAALAVPAGFFLVRLFTVQHDCGHGSYFRSKRLNDWVGRCVGVLTVTPYFVWKQSHTQHHATSGLLDGRGAGDIVTLTVEEYRAKSLLGRIGYRAYRNPVTLFALGPAFVFLLQNRLPYNLRSRNWRDWASALGTNLAIAAFAAPFIYAFGAAAFLTVFLVSVLVAATIGVWLFYVQHQFDGTHWSRHGDWQIHEAALYGSSFYDLPPIAMWLTGNIGIHHVHHLNSRIPSYRLPEALQDHPELREIKRMNFRESLSCVNLHLWDEQEQELVSFATARRRV